MKVSGSTSSILDDLDHPSKEKLRDDERWMLAKRIVASKSFSKSSFLTNFLLYVCDRELRGQADEITEYQIGIQAFGRPANYNPGEDNIVRNYARLLRKRLDEYFEAEGKDESIRISIPRGHYVPAFHPRAETPSSPRLKGVVETTDGDDEIVAAPTGATPASQSRTSVSRGLLILLTTVAGVAIAFGYFGTSLFRGASVTLSRHFWAEFFTPGRETLIVPADSGFGILQNLMQHPIHLGEYVTGGYASSASEVPGVDGRNWNDLRTQQYTSMVDLRVVLSLSRLPEATPKQFVIRYARDVRIEDLKHSNAILIGSSHSNPWDELFQPNLNFSLEYKNAVDDSVVVNRHPVAGESSVYKNAWAEDSHQTYTVVAFIPSLDGKGHVILLEGLNMAGTQAAADFLLNEQAMSPVLEKARRADGTFQPFELLLETSSIGANAPEARVVAERFGGRKASQP
jgi:hypothetical protein